MKKLIEFQEEKHREVLDVISQYRAENNTTFSEAVRKLILLSTNGTCPPDESVQPVDFYQLQADMTKRFEEIEDKVKVLIKASKKFKDFMKDIESPIDNSEE